MQRIFLLTILILPAMSYAAADSKASKGGWVTTHLDPHPTGQTPYRFLDDNREPSSESEDFELDGDERGVSVTITNKTPHTLYVLRVQLLRFSAKSMIEIAGGTSRKLSSIDPQSLKISFDKSKFLFVEPKQPIGKVLIKAHDSKATPIAQKIVEGSKKSHFRGLHDGDTITIAQYSKRLIPE